jgi:hypothetical protein
MPHRPGFGCIAQVTADHESAGCVPLIIVLITVNCLGGIGWVIAPAACGSVVIPHARKRSLWPAT